MCCPGQVPGRRQPAFDSTFRAGLTHVIAALDFNRQPYSPTPKLSGLDRSLSAAVG